MIPQKGLENAKHKTLNTILMYMKSKIKKRTISSALIEKYITGKTTLDEWIHVITAIKRKPSVRKKVEESRRIFNELYGNAPCSNPESRKDGYTEKGL